MSHGVDPVDFQQHFLFSFRPHTTVPILAFQVLVQLALLPVSGVRRILRATQSAVGLFQLIVHLGTVRDHFSILGTPGTMGAAVKTHGALGSEMFDFGVILRF